MELNNLILEQTDPNYSDWNSTEPKDYASNKSKYILKYIKVGGKPVQHYKLVSTTTDLSQYVGSYKEGVVTGDITDNDGTLTVSFKGMTGDLTNKGGDNFEFVVKGKTGTVKFTKDAQGKVNGFDYSWTIFNGHADKVDSSATSTSTTNTTTTTTPVKKADESKFNCIKNSNTNGKNLKQTKNNPSVYSFIKGDGSEFAFWDNGDFAYWDGDTQAIGKWKCVGSNNFIANMDWKGTTYYYRSETNQWGFTPNDKKINENIIKKIVSKNLKSLIK